jgi:hypothetical protein
MPLGRWGIWEGRGLRWRWRNLWCGGGAVMMAVAELERRRVCEYGQSLRAAEAVCIRRII